MSSSDPADEFAEIILTVESIRTNNYVAVAALTLVVYDFALTFKREVTTVWGRKVTGASILFFVNRYLSIMCATLVVAMNSITVQASCNGAGRTFQVVTLVLILVFALFSALRIYAVWERNIILSVLILALDLVPFGMNLSLYSVLSFFAIGAPYNECVGSDPRSISLDLKLTRATRLCVISADALVIFLIWIKTYRLSKQTRSLGMSMGVSAMLMRDGTIYFITLLVVNVCHLIIYETKGLPYISIFIPTVTAVLISRFLLNLRQVNEDSAGGASVNFSQFSAPAFRIPESIIGNLGEELEHGPLESEADVYEGDMEVEDEGDSAKAVAGA